MAATCGGRGGDEALGSLSRLSVDGVRAWLREKVGADERIQELFVLNGIDGKALQSLVDAELLAMGVETEETRRRILSARFVAASSVESEQELSDVSSDDHALGKGFFGEVRRGFWRHVPVALKSLFVESEFFSEVAVLKRLSHPNVIQFFGITCHRCIVTELAEGSVLDLVRREKNLSEAVLFSFSRDCAAGMEYLILAGVLHRDLAARNLLYLRTGDSFRAKITDFGLARFCRQPDGTIFYTASGRILPLKWTAPEALRDYLFTEKSDVWSFGVVLLEIFGHGVEPFDVMRPNNNAEMLKVLEKNHLEPPVGCNSEIAQVMQSCWNLNSESRPTFKQLNQQLSALLSPAPAPASPEPTAPTAAPAPAPTPVGYGTQLYISLQHQPSPTPSPQKPLPVCSLDFEAEKKKGVEGIRNIIAALKAHAENVDVCSLACFALWVLAINDENKVLIAREGGIPLIIAALKTHATNADVSDSACGALRNLASNSDEHNAVIARAIDLDPSFRFVYVPADASVLPEEWTLEYAEDDSVGCLIARLQQHYRDEEARISAGLDAAARTARSRAMADALRRNLPPAAAQHAADARLADLAGMSHLVGQVALLDGCAASRNVAVMMYINDMGTAKGLPRNARASEICALAGNPADIHGDAFVARYFDDNADDFHRLDFALGELRSDAPWLALAADIRRRRPRMSPEEMARVFDRTSSSSSSAQPQTQPAAAATASCAVCGKPAGMRCSRCKAAWYCGAECQKRAWPDHRKVCKKI